MKGILRHVFTVGSFTALSRVLGLVREMLQARLIGAGVEQSAFTLAFALPNMARKLFGEGALTAAFVPIFKGEIESASLEKAAALARAVMTTVLLMLGAIVLLSIGGLEIFVAYRDELGLSKRTLITVRLVKTLLPYMIFICGAAFGMGVLNTLGRFKASSFMPCFLNVVWISILAWIGFHDAFFGEPYRPEQRIHRIAMAILIAGAVQMLFMFWMMARAGVVPKLCFAGWRTEAVRRVWHNLGIAALGAGAIQINYMLDQVLAQVASPWAAGVIGYAERLMDLPLGVVGVAFGTVLLPTFAGFFAKGDVAGARKALGSSLKSLMFIMLPAATGLCVLAPEITRVIYQGGDFDAVATVRVSRALAVYAIGLGFFSFQKTMVPWFQAQSDMKTPLRVSLATVALNAFLNILAVFILPVEWRHVGLAASTVFCAGVGCVLLTVYAHRRNGSLGLLSCVGALARMTAAALAMAAMLVVLKPFLATLAPVFALAVFIFTGALVYGALAFWLLPDSARALLRRSKTQGEGVKRGNFIPPPLDNSEKKG